MATAEVTMEDEDARFALMGVVSGLTENQREVLVDRVLLNRTHARIAADMGLSRPGVQYLERRAKKTVAGLLGYDTEAEPCSA
jgi:DNA-directed RNA polymerase specialized sigma24 family protein